MRVGKTLAAVAAMMMAHASSQLSGAPWQRNIRMRRVYARTTPVPDRTGSREVGRYRQDDRGIVHRLSREERK